MGRKCFIKLSRSEVILIKMLKTSEMMQNSRTIISSIAILFLICVPFKGVSQKIIHVKSALGICTISNITPEQARKTAIEEAKNAALIQAGVNENVMAYSTFE